MIFLVLVSTVGVAVAEDASVGIYTFTVPDGYSITQTEDNLVVMQLDENNVVNFATEVDSDIDAAKENLISQGNELIQEDTINYNDMEINLQSFKTSNGLFSYNYIFLGDNGNFAVTVVTNNADFDADLEAEGNPATTIFDSVVEN